MFKSVPMPPSFIVADTKKTSVFQIFVVPLQVHFVKMSVFATMNVYI